MKGKISHIAIYTHKLDESIFFYEKLFGFRKGFTLTKEDGKPWIEYLMNDNGDFLELFNVDQKFDDNEVNTEKEGFFHFCIEVDNILELVKKTEEIGIALHKPLKIGLDNNQQCWVQDPNGVLIEAMEVVESSPQAKLRFALSQRKN